MSMQFEENVSLARYSNLQVGGPARYFKAVSTREDLIEALQTARAMDLPVFVLGGGTNILWSDRGYDGLVLKPEISFIRRDGDTITAGVAVTMAALVDFSVKEGLAGLDWAGGLPGTFGGAIFGNAGCFGGEIKDSVAEVESVDIVSARPVKRGNKECHFGYRDSIFKSEDTHEIIVQATLRLKKGDPVELARRIVEQKQYREERQPLDRPNIGSFFKNVRIEDLPKGLVNTYQHVIKTDPFPVIPAAYLIHEAGLKGTAVGRAMVSPKHPNFLVNMGGAEAQDFIQLIARVKEGVRRKTGIELEEEIRMIK